jgi:hypothetical protein
MARLLTTTGYGNTGSSAVTNILEEFDGIKTFGNKEFTFAHEPDGIADLEASLKEGHRLKVDLAIKRFLNLIFQLAGTEDYKRCFGRQFGQFAIEYIDSFANCQWQGWWHRISEFEKASHKNKFRQKLAESFFKRLFKPQFYDLYEPDEWRPHYDPHAKEYYANIALPGETTAFISKTKIFTDRLLKEAFNNNNTNAEDYRYILLDQAVPAIMTSTYTRYFSSPKVIIVDRDPRDLYALNKALWGSGYIPSCDVNIFIRWYSKTRFFLKNYVHSSPSPNTEEILFLPFEALVYEYDFSLQKIIRHIEFEQTNHIYKQKYFNPELSQKNTNIFPQYPDLIKDIQLIEKHLGEYCYNFPSSKTRQSVRSKTQLLVEDINIQADIAFQTGKIPAQYEKDTLFILFNMTMFAINMKRIKNRKGIPFIKSLVKILFSLPVLPIEYLFVLILYCFTMNKH